MSYLTEGSPIRKVSETEPGSVPDLDRISRLEAEFPGKVELIPAGSTLYHHSNSLRELVSRGVFDYKLSLHDGGFFFSDLPAKRANCTVEVESDLILFNSNDLTTEERNQLRTIGNGNEWIGGSSIGFDGKTYVNPDPFVELEGGVHGTEIVIFRSSLRKLGKITPVKPLCHPLTRKR